MPIATPPKKLRKKDGEYSEVIATADSNGGLKNDSGKLDWSLLDLELLEPIVYRYTVGAQKYAPNNWKTLKNAEDRYYSAAMRHLAAYRKGERDDLDPRFSEYPSHMAAVVWNFLCLLYFEMQDRKKEEQQSTEGK